MLEGFNVRYGPRSFDGGTNQPPVTRAISVPRQYN